MRPYILAEAHYKDLKDLEVDLAVLPWGATEAHNYHLPYGTDNYESEALTYEAARIAVGRGAKLMVLPTVPFGVNTGQLGIPMTINLHPRTQQAILEDLLESLDKGGVQRLLIVNGHGGNDFKQILRSLGQQYPGMMLATCNWFQSVDKAEFFEEEGDHADEMETSLMLYARPALVLPLEQAGDGNSKSFRVDALNESWAWTERKWVLATEDTGVGFPRKASAEKGRLYFEAVSEKLATLMLGLAGTRTEEIYG